MRKKPLHLFSATAGLICLLLMGADRLPHDDVRAAPVNQAPAELLHDDIQYAALDHVAATHVIWMEVTAYCPCTKCCGPNANGMTASGKPVTFNGGVFVAADTNRLPFGTRLSIPGYDEGQSVQVIDRGSAIKGERLDVFFPTHEQALQWGRQRLPVTVIGPAGIGEN
jgi:3D (Asp-Asp-Asp) domain-containing protein